MLRRGGMALAAIALMLAYPAGTGAAPSQDFSSEVASTLLQQLTQGFVTHNRRQALSVFEGARMKGYGQLRDEITSLFAQYESFRAAYRVRQSWPQGERGVVLAEFDLEGTPLEEGSPPLRRSGQLRFQFERGRRGWRIVEVEPRTFF
jgi:hypothetical protein